MKPSIPSPAAQLADENRQLRAQIEKLKQTLASETSLLARAVAEAAHWKSEAERVSAAGLTLHSEYEKSLNLFRLANAAKRRTKRELAAVPEVTP